MTIHPKKHLPSFGVMNFPLTAAASEQVPSLNDDKILHPAWLLCAVGGGLQITVACLLPRGFAPFSPPVYEKYSTGCSRGQLIILSNLLVRTYCDKFEYGCILWLDIFLYQARFFLICSCLSSHLNPKMKTKSGNGIGRLMNCLVEIFCFPNNFQ